MRLGRILAAAAVSAALVSSPVIAATGSASALSLGAAVPSSARAGADMDDQSDIHGGFIIPLLVVAAVIGAVVAIASGDDNAPSSP